MKLSYSPSKLSENHQLAAGVLNSFRGSDVMQTSYTLFDLVNALGYKPSSEDLIETYKTTLSEFRALKAGVGPENRQYSKKLLQVKKNFLCNLSEKDVLTLAIADLIARTKYQNEFGDGNNILREYKDYLEFLGYGVDSLIEGNERIMNYQFDSRDDILDLLE